MIATYVKFSDGLSKALTRLSMALLVGLIGLTTFEVVSRYLFAAPTMWGIDVTFLLNGALFSLGAAFTLLANEHVKIDVFSSRLPRGIQRGVGAAFYILLFLPVIGMLTYVAFKTTWHAFATDDRVLSSAWRPYKWPFYLPLAIGLAALWLQSLAETLRLVARAPDAEAAGSPQEFP